jgi:hypothetical protein
MTQQDSYRMIEGRARLAGIRAGIGNDSPRASRITDHLKKWRWLGRAPQDGKSRR